MRKFQHSKKIYLGALAALLLAVSMIFLQSCDEYGFSPNQDGEDGRITYDGVEYTLKKDVETFLVMGLDKFEEDTSPESYNNNKQADALVLFVFDNEQKTCAALQIDRDTMAEINRLDVAGNKMSTVTAQIALAHTEGNGREVSCRNTADAVSGLLLGTRINHYLSISMDAVAVLNDLVGGVEVTVLEDFTSIDPALAEGETVTLRGEQALTYIRTRSIFENSSNIARMERQRQYITSLHKQFKRCVEADDEFIIKSSLEVSEYIVSDRSITQLQTLANKFNEYESLGIKTIDGESKLADKYMEFYADADSVQKLVIELFYEPAK